MLKKKRIKNPKLLAKMRLLPCVVCKKTPVDVHHLTTRSAGGEDVETNLVSLCRIHHSMLHQYGVIKFCLKYPRFQLYIEKLGRDDLLNHGSVIVACDAI